MTENKVNESEIMMALKCAYLHQTTDVRTYKGMPIEEFSKAVCDLLESKNARIAQLHSLLKSERLFKIGIAEPYSAGVRDCAEIIKACEKVSVGHSLKVIMVAESEIDVIAEELIREKEYYSNFSKRNWRRKNEK